MKLTKRSDGWWITGDDHDDCGPYVTKADATEDLKGLERTEKYAHLRSFWSSTRKSTPGG